MMTMATRPSLSILLILYTMVSGAASFATSRATGILSRPSLASMTKPSTTCLAMGLTLYGHPGTRSPLCNWAAKELGVALAAGDLGRNPHPFGQIPSLTDEGDVLVFESGAILIYLVQKYATGLTDAQRASVVSWITWANASLDKICFLETPEGKVYDTGLRRPNKRLAQLDEILSKQEYLVPSAGFSVADVAVASYLLYVLQFFPDTDLGPWPAVRDYLKRCAGREAYGAAFGAAVQGRLLDLLVAEPPKKLFGVF